MRFETCITAISSIMLWLLLGGYFGASSVVAQQFEEDLKVELARAEENAKATEKNYQTVKRLSEQGSASQRQLRRAELERNLASLTLAGLLVPMLEEKNQLRKAQLILEFREQELKVIGDLFEHRSASQLSYRRAVVARDIAQANLGSLQSSTETQRTLQQIRVAQSKYELARLEHGIAKRLFESGSISQPRFDRATSNLTIALTELETRKKSLGARAVQIRQ